MEGVYDIMLADTPVGTVEVTRQGLYYRFDCRCKLSGTVICRVSVECGGHHENLGILVPTGDWFYLSTKLAVKRLGKGIPHFSALPKHRERELEFIPVYPEEPFAYLTRLQDAFLQIRDGQVGVALRSGQR